MNQLLIPHLLRQNRKRQIRVPSKLVDSDYGTNVTKNRKKQKIRVELENVSLTQDKSDKVCEEVENWGIKVNKEDKIDRMSVDKLGCNGNGDNIEEVKVTGTKDLNGMKETSDKRKKSYANAANVGSHKDFSKKLYEMPTETNEYELDDDHNSAEANDVYADENRIGQCMKNDIIKGIDKGTSTTSTSSADNVPIPTNASSHATFIPIPSQDVNELNPNAMIDGNTFVNPFANPSTSAAVASSSSQNVDPSNMHTKSVNKYSVLEELDDDHNSAEANDVYADENRIGQCIENDIIKETRLKAQNLQKKIRDSVFKSWSWIDNKRYCDKGCRIMLGWNSNLVKINIVHYCKQSVLCKLKAIKGDLSMFYTIVYAANGGSKRIELWKELRQYKRMVGNNAWAIMVYVNVTLDPK
nr:RNA-directed DNA polymerase, eukaryota, reverse transcriptase zinc-binding domain protein [Tanacetum cinerariifolium]